MVNVHVIWIISATFVAVQGQGCVDFIPSSQCFPLFCRFFPSYRAQCRKTCGDCNTVPSPFDSWSKCSRTCDGGTRFRIRSCSLNDPEQCPRDYQDCNSQPCPTVTCVNAKHRYNTTSSCCSPLPNNPCGVSSEPTSRIIGGSIAMQGMWPWMVRLEVAQANLCGGVLISSRWLVTAAHCIDNINANQIVAFVGYDTPQQERIPVEAYAIHPNYDLPANDIAVVKLSRSVRMNEFVRTLCLPNGEVTPDDTKCFIAGWGVTDFRVPIPSPRLQEARVRILPFRACTEAYKNRTISSKLSSNLQICAGALSGRVDSCLGDSGGPIMCQRRNSCTWYVAGLVSVGPSACGTPNEPGIYTKMITFQSWIEQQMQRI